MAVRVGATVLGLVMALAQVSAPRAAQATVGAQDPGHVFKPGDGVTNPKLVRKVDPRYTGAALRAGIEGAVWLDVVVMPDGRVGKVEIEKSLDRIMGLDAEAVAAAKQWEFEPATFEGRPVPVEVTLILEFRRHEKGADDEASLPVSGVPAPLPVGRTNGGRIRAAIEAGDPVGGQAQPGIAVSRIFPPAPESDATFLAGAVRADAPGVVAPVVAGRVMPRYTREALQNGLEGMVAVEAVIDVSGEVARVRIQRSLDTVFGLDQQALEAALGWRFKPGTRGGDPVPVVVVLNMEFRLH
ncbi:MAG: energy transducer TonB [Vicinamibacterales bacterium]